MKSSKHIRVGVLGGNLTYQLSWRDGASLDQAVFQRGNQHTVYMRAALGANGFFGMQNSGIGTAPTFPPVWGTWGTAQYTDLTDGGETTLHSH